MAAKATMNRDDLMVYYKMALAFYEKNVAKGAYEQAYSNPVFIMKLRKLVHVRFDCCNRGFWGDHSETTVLSSSMIKRETLIDFDDFLFYCHISVEFARPFFVMTFSQKTRTPNSDRYPDERSGILPYAVLENSLSGKSFNLNEGTMSSPFDTIKIYPIRYRNRSH